MASAAASSNYTDSAATSSKYAYAASFNDNMGPKFNDYRSRVMLGELPIDFLRIQLIQAQVYDSSGYGPRQGQQQQPYQNPNFLGYFTLSIAEAKLVKNSGLLGLIKMDPYVTFRIGHVSYDTPTANGGGKNPQWKVSYRINLFKGMDNIHLEVYDQRNFTEDSFIGESEIPIPREVMEGETRQQWYPLMGRQANANDNQGDILVVMSFVAMRTTNQPPVANATGTPVVNPIENASFPTGSAAAAAAVASSFPHQLSNTNEQSSVGQHSPSAIPKPPPPAYSTEDVRTIEEMFPNTDRRMIIDLFDNHGGNKDLVVNYLLQNTV